MLISINGRLSTHSGHSRVSVADLHRAHRAAVGREAGVADRRPVLDRVIRIPLVPMIRMRFTFEATTAPFPAFPRQREAQAPSKRPHDRSVC